MSTKWSKRDYEMVAEVLNKVASDHVHDNGFSRGVIGAIEEEFIAVFSEDNSEFDVVLFRAAVKP